MNRLDNDYEARKARIKRRRIRQLRRRAFLISIVFSMMIAVFCACRTFAQADDSRKLPAYKYYTSYEIKEGDTLWSIAETYMDDAHYDSVNDYIKEVKSINGLTNDTIHADCYLVIPYYSAEAK